MAEDWQPTAPPNPPEARYGHSMVALPDGRVMLFGGADANQDLFNDLHDFNGSAWNPVQPNNAPPPARRSHRAWLRGQNMVVSGGYGADGVLNDVWSYDTTANTWQQVSFTGDTPAARFGHTVTPYSDGSVLLLGGTSADGQRLSDLWQLNADNSFERLPDCPYAYSGHIAQPSANGEMLFVFGEPAKMLFYLRSERSWASYNGGFPISGGATAAMSRNAKGEPVILVFGGKDANGQESKQVYAFNTVTGELSQRDAMPAPVTDGSAAVLSAEASPTAMSLPGPAPAAATAVDRHMLFFGGISNGVPVNASLLFALQRVRGDVNGDTVVDLADVVLSLKLMCAASPGAATVLSTAAVNSEGRIGPREVIYILQIAAGQRF